MSTTIEENTIRVSLSVVKNDSHRASMPRAKPTHAVTKVNSIYPRVPCTGR
jgi:hypothetical protein